MEKAKVPPHANAVFQRAKPNDDRRGRRLATGTKEVLALRAVAPDASTTASESTISDQIFGTSGESYIHDDVVYNM